MNETKMVSLNRVRNNPWRDLVRNPIDPERVEAIQVSIDKTGKYWIGTYGREMPDGTVQLAFGHNRYMAAKAQGLKEIPITLEPFTDGEMLVWMAQENVRGELPVVIEAVSAAVRALGEGKIEIEAPDPKTNTKNLRYAPSFITGKCTSSPTVGAHVYTVKSIAKYLGYTKHSTGEPKDSVHAAMGILERAEIAGAEGGETGRDKARATELSLAKLKVNEAVKVISDIREREDKVKQRQEKTAAETAEFDRKQRELQAKRKEEEKAAAAARAKLVADLAEAKREEDAKRAKEIKARLEAKEAADAEKETVFKIRQAALNAQVEERRVKEAIAKKEDEYLPVKRETERILHKLQGETATTKEALSAEVKALARLPLNNTDRERLRQAALSYGTWYIETCAMQFIPPLSIKSKLSEYRSREEAKRRAQEVKAEKEKYDKR